MSSSGNEMEALREEIRKLREAIEERRVFTAPHPLVIHVAPMPWWQRPWLSVGELPPVSWGMLGSSSAWAFGGSTEWEQP